jgi:hypothetical protein
MNMKASRALAFATGVAVAIPVLTGKYLGMAGFFSRFLVVLVCLCYVVAIVVFVFGPQRWNTFRWVPVDGTPAVMGRGISWLLGGLLSIAALEAINAI